MATLLAGLLVLALPAATDLSGKWSGTFEAQNARGETRSQPILIILKQEGAELSGTGGPDESERHPILNGKVDGDKLTLEVSAGHAKIYFDLKATETELSGRMRRVRADGTTSDTAKIILKRAQ
jgi:hypothetical protein